MNGTSNKTNGTPAKMSDANGTNGTPAKMSDTNGTNGTSSITNGATLPSASSPNLHLAHPTLSERRQTWRKNAVDWGKALPLPTYMAREETLSTATSLVQSGGLTHWILVDRSLPPDQRPILASCESIRKRTLVKTPGSAAVREQLSHGVGSVFCYPEFRGHGYASRMMREVGAALRDWQGDVACSMLYSDIGKSFYAAHGWAPFPSTHLEFPPVSAAADDDDGAGGEVVRLLKTADLPPLCAQDERMLTAQLARAPDAKTHVAIPPDAAHFEWHRAREEFLTSHLFGAVPEVRGALAGEEGKRVWAVWTRSYCGGVGDEKAGNTLHVLRLVVEEELLCAGGEAEGDVDVEGLARKLRAVVGVAQREAGAWKCERVEVWNPSALVREVVERMGVAYRGVERERDSIASVMWYGKEGREGEDVEWVGNEKYGWC